MKRSLKKCKYYKIRTECGIIVDNIFKNFKLILKYINKGCLLNNK